MYPGHKTMQAAIDVACNTLTAKLTNQVESLLDAGRDVIGENEGDTGIVSVGTTLSFQFENGKPTIDASVKGSFVERRVTFKSEPTTVGDPDPNQGKFDFDGDSEDEDEDDAEPFEFPEDNEGDDPEQLNYDDMPPEFDDDQPGD